MTASRYDFVFYDTVGMRYTGATPAQTGVGGSEFQAILLAEALAARGLTVLVLNNTLESAREGGVDYTNHAVVDQANLECDVLLVQRYSRLPRIRARKILIAASDVPGTHYDHFGELFASSRDATMVAVSAWQRQLFPKNWPCVVIPNMLPDFVYEAERTANPRKFLYASAALKGLQPTLAAWKELRDGNGMGDAELCVCTPGYDAIDADFPSTDGLRFLGSLPFQQLVEEIASSAGLFYVNAWSETFGIAAALAEALKRRTHILCTSDPGALPETVTSPLITTDRTQFFSEFRAALISPDAARWYGAARDYRVSTVISSWLDLFKAAPPPRTPLRAKVCLSMIVKNEAHVIERCLRSVKPYVDAWAISDTGSSDGTQDIIRNFMSDVPGELIERPWVDFSTNRNEALELARRFGDYALIIDADDVAEVDSGFSWPNLDAVGYSFEIIDGGDTRYRRVALPRLDAKWTWRGVLHEALCTPQPVAATPLHGLRILRTFNDGARSQHPQTEKYLRDAEVLRRALDQEPANARYAFYLAQSLRDAGQLPESIIAYEKRVAMGGWDEEVYFSKFQLGVLKERTGAAYADVVATYLDAYDFRPARAEAPCALARYLRLHKRYAAARDFARTAAGLPLPDDILFIDRSVHDWRARDEWSVAAYWCGEYVDSARLCRELLADARLPESERARVQCNLEFSLPHLRSHS
ncbi:MAG: glycosyltransferase [Dokdonella sp.]